ncbi:MAG: hypothetical protein NXH86_00245 [Flavobacteriaceae bacterium]|nr:hypothetical protein [Flavobacteriaceae bacterium]
MKTLNVIIAVMLMAYGHTVSGQKALDTIRANSQMNVALFFFQSHQTGCNGKQ